MPQAISRAFSSGAVITPDGQDQGDMYAAGVNERRRDLLQQRLDQLYQNGNANQLGMAELGQRDREFQANRGDNLSLRQAMIAANSKQFDYMAGRDALGDKHWQAQFESERPGRESRSALENAQAQAMIRELNRQEQANERQNVARNVPPPAELARATPQHRAKYQSDLAMTGDPTIAAANLLGSDQEDAARESEALGADFGQSVRRFNENDSAYFSEDPTESDAQALRLKFNALKERLRGSGLSESAATAKANSIFSQNATRKDINSGWTRDLARELGIIF